ncbi:MAG: hypothetical protein U1E18_24525 [Brevundimonas sp.]|uniref:hypothetical protein n=1 Tax=Brevundimonas sp. TaxID=1871086 RepID=UPI002AB921B5|nr:hypothetical protein [Brevundimonas sp.]MDZ4112745.1 hypothetical protein [Brevundimonas sp.]
MTLFLLAVAAVAIAAPATAQGSLPDVPRLAGAPAAPDCGNLYGMAGKAFCVSAPLAAIGALADAYVAEFEARGWLPAGGDDNRVVFVRRREAGGCDGLQMQAFYDTSRPAGPEATGYLGFGQIPGDVCAAGESGAATGPAPQQ